MKCNKLTKDLAGDKWTLGYLKALCTEELWNWAKSDALTYDGDAYLGFNKCVNFDKELCFE